jgi:hypothetical protein
VTDEELDTLFVATFENYTHADLRPLAFLVSSAGGAPALPHLDHRGLGNRHSGNLNAVDRTINTNTKTI